MFAIQARRKRQVLVAAIFALVVLGGRSEAPAYEAHHAMVTAEHELAALAGVRTLSRGGNAIDAAVAAALAVGVTNASSCGIGGGGFMLIYLAHTGKFYALDYRETAAASARPGLYVREGKPDDNLARSGPLAVAVPGELAGMQAALEKFGTMKFPVVAQPAIEIARNGFPCGEHLAAEIKMMARELAHDPTLKAVFLNPDGSPRNAGDKIVETELAGTLESLGEHPAESFYHGAVAQKIAAFMKAHGGLVTAEDLANYRPVWADAVHAPYRDFEVYSMPPPSSGGGMVLEMLEMLSSAPVGGLGVNSPPYLARLIEVMKQGFADRAVYGDPGFVKVPIEALLAPEHIEAARDKALHRAPAAPAPAANDHGTSQLCVVDQEGNVVSLTTTINTAFGAQMAVPGLGIILNNEMDDFAVAPGVSNMFRLVGSEKNAIAPGRHPVSSMAPTIVTKAGKPVLVLGGSGGPTIITGVLQVALDVLDFHMDPQRAVPLARIHEQGQPDVVAVEEAIPAVTQKALGEMGYKLRVVPHLGAVNAILITPGLLSGAYDPRKGGGAAGY